VAELRLSERLGFGGGSLSRRAGPGMHARVPHSLACVRARSPCAPPRLCHSAWWPPARSAEDGPHSPSASKPTCQPAPWEPPASAHEHAHMWKVCMLFPAQPRAYGYSTTGAPCAHADAPTSARGRACACAHLIAAQNIEDTWG